MKKIEPLKYLIITLIAGGYFFSSSTAHALSKLTQAYLENNMGKKILVTLKGNSSGKFIQLADESREFSRLRMNKSLANPNPTQIGQIPQSSRIYLVPLGKINLVTYRVRLLMPGVFGHNTRFISLNRSGTLHATNKNLHAEFDLRFHSNWQTLLTKVALTDGGQHFTSPDHRGKFLLAQSPIVARTSSISSSNAKFTIYRSSASSWDPFCKTGNHNIVIEPLNRGIYLGIQHPDALSFFYNTPYKLVRNRQILLPGENEYSKVRNNRSYKFKLKVNNTKFGPKGGYLAQLQSLKNNRWVKPDGAQDLEGLTHELLRANGNVSEASTQFYIRRKLSGGYSLYHKQYDKFVMFNTIRFDLTSPIGPASFTFATEVLSTRTNGDTGGDPPFNGTDGDRRTQFQFRSVD